MKACMTCYRNKIVFSVAETMVTPLKRGISSRLETMNNIDPHCTILSLS